MNDNSLKLPKFKYHPNVYDKEKVLDEMKAAQIKTLRMTDEKESKHQIVKNWFEIANIVENRGVNNG